MKKKSAGTASTAEALPAIAEARPLSFELEGKRFLMRPPTPEEYDSARFIERLALKQMLARPDIKALRARPISEGEREMFERAIAEAKEAWEALDDKDPQKRTAGERLVSLQEELDTRTLADEAASDWAVLRRDRFLTRALLCNEDGSAYFDAERDEADDERWQALKAAVKNDLRSYVWVLLQRADNAPLPWAPLPDSSSS